PNSRLSLKSGPDVARRNMLSPGEASLFFLATSRQKP
ncbi:hypothetical protein A2U01_0093679, partial [Trifolium medium]|nr:hypothetical protein [Trifolium medium]